MQREARDGYPAKPHSARKVYKSYAYFTSGIDSVEGAGEGDGFADVVEAADPGYGSLDAHAEAGVGDAAAEVEVPLEGG